jgi:hypothetical protein
VLKDIVGVILKIKKVNKVFGSGLVSPLFFWSRLMLQNPGLFATIKPLEITHPPLPVTLNGSELLAVIEKLDDSRQIIFSGIT